MKHLRACLLIQAVLLTANAVPVVAAGPEHDAEGREIVRSRAFTPLPDGQVFTADLTLQSKGKGFRFKNLDFFQLAVVIIATEDVKHPIIAVLSKDDIKNKTFQGRTDESEEKNSIIFQTRLGGDMLLDLKPPPGKSADGFLMVHLTEPHKPPLTDFTLNITGEEPPTLPRDESDPAKLPEDAPEACVVDGGGGPSRDTLGDNPADRAELEKRRKAMADLQSQLTQVVGAYSSLLKPFLDSITSTVKAPPGLGAPSPSGLFGALPALPVALFPDDFACNTALVQESALPRVPVSCPWSLRHGTNCYRRAYAAIDGTRLTLKQLACIHAAERKRFDILFAVMQGVAGAAGIIGPGLQLKAQQTKKWWEDNYLATAKAKKVELIESLRAGLIKLGQCEAEFGDFPGWYARVGFSYEMAVNNQYEIK